MKILTLEHPIIRKKLKPVGRVDGELKKTIEAMRKTVVDEKDPEGVGLAANQVGLDLRLFLAKITQDKGKKEQKKSDAVRAKDFIPFINPEITSFSKEMDEVFEGCLSIPDLFGFVKRPKGLTARYTNSEGKVVTKEFSGMPARIIQHEVDHLNGRLFIDHVAIQTKELFRYLGTNDKGEPKFEKVKLE